MNLNAPAAPKLQLEPGLRPATGLSADTCLAVLSLLLVSSSFPPVRAHLAASLTKTGSEKCERPLRRNVAVCDRIDLNMICVWMSVFVSVHMCVSVISPLCVSHGGLCSVLWLSSLNIPADHENDSPCVFLSFFLWPPALWHILALSRCLSLLI